VSRRRLSVAFAAAALVAAAGCSDGPRVGMPDSISEQGDEILGLWRGSVYAGLAVLALVWGLVVWCVFRYRRRNDDLPSQMPENIPIELLYTATPLVIVVVLFAFTLVTQDRVTALVDDPDVTIEVVGFQWSWEFRYPDQDLVVRSNGVDPPQLVVPVDATVRFRLLTRDVVHSFWVPDLLLKRDLINEVDNEIDVHVNEAGEWRGRCAEFCGLDHWRMYFDLVAVPQDQFEQRLTEAAAA
jgi:cytochrome c oxidase subunit 2